MSRLFASRTGPTYLHGAEEVSVDSTASSWLQLAAAGADTVLWLCEACWWARKWEAETIGAAAVDAVRCGCGNRGGKGVLHDAQVSFSAKYS